MKIILITFLLAGSTPGGKQPRELLRNQERLEYLEMVERFSINARPKPGMKEHARWTRVGRVFRGFRIFRVLR